ncbi:MAG: hypothetical protein ACI9J4_001290 [Paraglaciecola sp.]|jgi:hypothetical protein
MTAINAGASSATATWQHGNIMILMPWNRRYFGCKCGLRRLQSSAITTDLYSEEKWQEAAPRYTHNERQSHVSIIRNGTISYC